MLFAYFTSFKSKGFMEG